MSDLYNTGYAEGKKYMAMLGDEGEKKVMKQVKANFDKGVEARFEKGGTVSKKDAMAASKKSGSKFSFGMEEDRTRGPIEKAKGGATATKKDLAMHMKKDTRTAHPDKKGAEALMKKSGGSCYAMGGAGKVRKGQATLPKKGK